MYSAKTSADHVDVCLHLNKESATVFCCVLANLTCMQQACLPAHRGTFNGIFVLYFAMCLKPLQGCPENALEHGVHQPDLSAHAMSQMVMQVSSSTAHVQKYERDIYPCT